MTSIPTIERPGFAQGYQTEDLPDFDPTPWPEALARMNQTLNCWVATTRADGRPHSTPVWGLMMNDTFIFSTSPESVKARNLQRDGRCLVQMQVEEDVFLLEGMATPADPALVASPAFLDLYEAKYQYRPAPEDMVGSGWVVTPITILAWNEKSMLESQTRYRF